MNNITTTVALTAAELAVIAELSNWLNQYAAEVFKLLENFTNMIVG